MLILRSMLTNKRLSFLVEALLVNFLLLSGGCSKKPTSTTTSQSSNTSFQYQCEFKERRQNHSRSITKHLRFPLQTAIEVELPEELQPSTDPSAKKPIFRVEPSKEHPENVLISYGFSGSPLSSMEFNPSPGGADKVEEQPSSPPKPDERLLSVHCKSLK